MRQFKIRCQITRRGYVRVEAEDEKEAMKKFNSMEWISLDEDCSLSDIQDFTYDGWPTEIGKE